MLSVSVVVRGVVGGGGGGSVGRGGGWGSVGVCRRGLGVAGGRVGRLVAHFWIFRMLLKGIFDAYVL